MKTKRYKKEKFIPQFEEKNGLPYWKHNVIMSDLLTHKERVALLALTRRHGLSWLHDKSSEGLACITYLVFCPLSFTSYEDYRETGKSFYVGQAKKVGRWALALYKEENSARQKKERSCG